MNNTRTLTSFSPLDIPRYGSASESDPIVIAGPCSAESRPQVIATAKRLAAGGIRVFRAGVWKPRTKPGCFEGAGTEALSWLREVKEETGMLVATEVATRKHVEEAVANGIDILWIGARTSANPFAMQEIADTLRDTASPDTPILVKNPVNPDIDLWDGAFQRLVNAGFRRLAAIHRGFTVFGSHTYRNMPVWHIPVELRLRYPTLPIICDPSPIGGSRKLVQPIARQALDLGFDGLIIESHCNPDCALSDAAQQLTPDALFEVLDSLKPRTGNPPSETLTLLRSQIDTLDNELIDILAKRMEISRNIGEYKRKHNMPVVQTSRFNELLDSRIFQGEKIGLDKTFMRKILLAIHDESVRQQI